MSAVLEGLMFAAVVGLDLPCLESRRNDDWTRRLKARLKSVAAILTTLAMLLAAGNLVLERAKTIVCDTLNLCESKNSRALVIWPAARAVAAQVPILPAYETGWMSGGHSAIEFCSPQQQMYAAQYPRFSISTQAQSQTRRDWPGRVSYRFTCEFHASPKEADG